MHGPESPASTNRLMEEICERENLKQALQQVKSDKGSAGVDGMTVGGITDCLKLHRPAIREQLLRGTYQPKPVRRVEIPKPDGGVRKLGIPTVLDRLIQQAVMQVLQRRWDPTFSEHSHGFRPKRSAHQAVAKAQQYIAAGNRWVVDLDLEKFFDRVNHDKLMAAIARRVTDKRVLRLIGAFLKVGVLENGLGDRSPYAVFGATKNRLASLVIELLGIRGRAMIACLQRFANVGRHLLRPVPLRMSVRQG